MPTPEFVVSLRQRVGHELLWLCGVTAVVLRAGREGPEVLLVRRSDTGSWTPVGGIVDPAEHPALTAEREVLEETGVVCEVEGLAAVTVGPPAAYPNGDRVQFLTHTFRCRHLRGEARVADEESVEVGWFPLDRLPAMRSFFLDRIRHAVEFDGSTRLPREQDGGPDEAEQP